VLHDSAIEGRKGKGGREGGKHWGPGFLFRILLFSQSGDHPEINLAKFDYILDLKVSPKKPKKSISILDYLLQFIIRLWPFGIF
jgi:hypothetical protein